MHNFFYIYSKTKFKIITFSIIAIAIVSVLLFKDKSNVKATAENLTSTKISVYFNNSDELING